jgi:hypothetical protein
MQSVWQGSDRDGLTAITSVSEYRGDVAVAIAATQLGTRYPRSQATRIVAEWVEFFSSGPSPITELHLRTRTPKRLFDALSGQSQLQRLFVKWGDYDDLAPLRSMNRLQALRLGGASSLRSVLPLSGLGTLTRLEIESLRHVRDLSPLASLTRLEQLEIGGDWTAPRTAHVDSLAWLPALRALTYLLLHTLVVDDLDYTPLLALPNLKGVRVMEARGMTPSHEELKSRLPWSG